MDTIAAIDKREIIQMIRTWYNGEELSNEKESVFIPGIW